MFGGKQFYYAPPGLLNFLSSPTHGLRRGLHSFAASRLLGFFGSSHKLIPDVFLVVGHVVLLEERYKLLLKRMLLVMFFLTGNIFCDGRNISTRSR